ncbi:MAG: glycosyltransferase family 4 protein [Panacagrimonas sp.]
MPRWIRPGRLNRLQHVGNLYFPGPEVPRYARERARFNTRAWSITGVTHTISSARAIASVVDLLRAPVMPWDALICTSRAVRDTVDALIEQEMDYLRLRLGANRFPLPQLPVISLGIHTDDFAASAESRQSARQRLQVQDDEIVLLFVGRLSVHAKGHPFPMIRAASEAAAQTGRRVRLLLCGWYANEATRTVFESGVAEYAPNIDMSHLDGRDPSNLHSAYAAADIFISLSDNIQESFGLTPVEAMAAGVPVVVTDWDGYRDTVRDGIDGFRVPTFAPPAEQGRGLALRWEAALDDYDRYIGRASLAVAADFDAVVDALGKLIANDSLRRKMGEAGQAHAQQHFDWRVIFQRYLELWRELAQRRRTHSEDDSAIAQHPSLWRENPFQTFAAFPTAILGPDTSVEKTQRSLDWSALRKNPMFSFGEGSLPDQAVISKVLATLQIPSTPKHVAESLELSLTQTILAMSWLAKVGAVRVDVPGDPEGREYSDPC